jgi:hypothetical protein
LKATISQYLLKLALDPHAAAQHNASPESAAKMMTEHGLNDHQQAIVASLDHTKITAAIQAELPEAQAGAPGFSFTIGGAIVTH